MTEQFMENISNEEHERLLLLCGHGIGPSLSPAALAVMTAGTMGNPNVINDPVYRQCIAAALRAAADQVVPHEYLIGVDVEAQTRQLTRLRLLAIAGELEGLNA